MPNNQILIVEDEAIVAADLEERLEKLGYNVPAVASSGEEAMRKVAEMNPKLVLMDIRLNGPRDGIEVAEEIRDRFDIPVAFLTAHADDDTLQRAKITEPYGYLIKPFDEKDLQVTVEMALYRHQSERTLRNIGKWLLNALSCIGDAIIATNRQGQLLLMNPAAEALVGWDLEEALHRDSSEILRFIYASSRAPVEDPVRCALRGGQISYMGDDVLLIGRGGTETRIDYSAAQILDQPGEILGVVLVLRDRSARKQSHAQTQQT